MRIVATPTICLYMLKNSIILFVMKCEFYKAFLYCVCEVLLKHLQSFVVAVTTFASLPGQRMGVSVG